MDPVLIPPPAPDPDVLAHTVARAEGVGRREALRRVGVYGAALAAAPMALAALSREAYAQSSGLPQQIRDVLSFALTLEFLERDFYQRGVSTSGLIPADTLDVFQTVAEHEADHVAFLQSALGLSGNGGRPAQGFDFTAGGQFNPFQSYDTFLILSQGFEDLGVRAYKGGAPLLMSNDTILTAALQIHSVEARHAATVRRIRSARTNNPALEAWVTGNGAQAPAPIQAVYGAGSPSGSFPAEGNVTQGGVDLGAALSQFSRDDITEAFDEPLDVQTVLNIADPFIVG